MLNFFYRLLLLLLSTPTLVYAAQEHTEDKTTVLTVNAPFIEVHSGPASAYPVFYVIERGETLQILKRKTNWFKVRIKQGKTGWVNQLAISKTQLPTGETVAFNPLDKSSFTQRQWEFGLSAGKLADAPITSISTAYVFNPLLSFEMSISQSIASVSSSSIYKANLLAHPFKEWAYSPFFNIGFGSITVSPKTTLINPKDKTNNLAQVGFGLKKHLSRRFVLRFDTNHYIIFSSNNDKDNNEGISEWKLGFAVFF